MTGHWIDEEREWMLREAFYGRDPRVARVYGEDSYGDEDCRGRALGPRSFSPATGGYERSTAWGPPHGGRTFRDEGHGPRAGYAPRPGAGPRGEELYREVYGYGPRDDLSRMDWEGRGGRGEPRDYERNFLDRAAERLSSWFGSEDEGRRERADHSREGGHRGRGPQAYKRPDERIADEIHERLTEDAWLDASNIAVSVSGGEVTLSGTVPEREGKHRAERLIEDLSGVTHMQNNLRVARGGFLTSPERGFGDSVQAAQMAQDDPGASPMGRRSDS